MQDMAIASMLVVGLVITSISLPLHLFVYASNSPVKGRLSFSPRLAARGGVTASCRVSRVPVVSEVFWKRDMILNGTLTVLFIGGERTLPELQVQRRE